MKLDTRQLRNLAAVVQEGTFMRAATVLNTSQPALSKSIRLLEHEVGAKVLERGRHGARPTPYGEALVFWYKRIEVDLREAAYHIEALKGLSEGHIAIGATRTVANHIVPAAVSALKVISPNIVVEILEDRAPNLSEALKDGRIDMMVGPVYGDPIGTELQEEFLFASHLVVVTRPGHPLTRRKTVKLRELTRYQYIGSGGDNTVARQVQLLLKTAKMSGLEYAVQSNSPQANKDIIRDSEYFGLLPEIHVETEVRARVLQVSKLNVAGNTWPFGVRWRRNAALSPAMEAFLIQLRTVSKRVKQNQGKQR
jgi:DNA-binding transcriptional LysR family regulator